MKEMWDQRYASHETVYGLAPNGYFKTCIDQQKPGTLLLPAEGEGRNAIYAARKGWKVHAVDFSEVARQKALDRAKTENLQIEYELADLRVWHTSKTYDCIALIYSHFPPEIRNRLHKRLTSSLNPGGTIIMECFHKNQLNYNSGGPKHADWLYNAKLLQNDFEELKLETLKELVYAVDENNFHQGKAALVRMHARKTA